MEAGDNAIVQTALDKLEQIKVEEQKRIGYRLFTLADVLARYGGGAKTFSWCYSDDKRSIHYDIDGEQRCSEVFLDKLSGERTTLRCPSNTSTTTRSSTHVR